MTPLEFLYFIGYSLDKHFKLKRQKSLPYPVISIGNITTGGTGKTPVTMAIAEEAKKRGYQPIILTRGYKGKAEEPCFVLANRQEDTEFCEFTDINIPLSSLHICTSTLDAGDEPLLMSERLKNVPIVKCKDRFKGGMYALEKLNTSKPYLFILDDGFQHWGLFRDIDIVLIDGVKLFGNNRLLPLGCLREPIKELDRADIFLITMARFIDQSEILNRLKDINPKAPIYFSEHKPIIIKDIARNEFPMNELRDKRVYAFCGVANPESFRRTLLSVGCHLAGFRIYRDHYRYSLKDILNLQKKARIMDCNYLVTTEKDMVKIRELESIDGNIIIYSIEIGLDIEPSFFGYVFEHINKLKI